MNGGFGARRDKVTRGTARLKKMPCSPAPPQNYLKAIKRFREQGGENRADGENAKRTLQ